MQNETQRTLNGQNALQAILVRLQQNPKIRHTQTKYVGKSNNRVERITNMDKQVKKQKSDNLVPATATVGEISFSDNDILNPEEMMSALDESGWKAFLFHDHGFTLGVVFAAGYDYALDILADAGKLKAFEVDEDAANTGHVICLGLDGRFHDIESVDHVALDIPPMSFCALYSSYIERSRR
jgi:hypothetical protein